MAISKSYELALNDNDLFPILQQANEKELSRLAEVISQKWSSTINKEDLSPLKITKEIQTMGGDSVVNLARDCGITYREVAEDIARKFKVLRVKDLDIIELESAILNEILKSYKKTLSDKEKEQFEEELKKASEKEAADIKLVIADNHNYARLLPTMLAIGAALAKRGSLNFIPIFGPVISALLAIIQAALLFTGPAYKVTMICVVIVGTIRARLVSEGRVEDIEI